MIFGNLLLPGFSLFTMYLRNTVNTWRMPTCSLKQPRVQNAYTVL